MLLFQGWQVTGGGGGGEEGREEEKEIMCEEFLQNHD